MSGNETSYSESNPPPSKVAKDSAMVHLYCPFQSAGWATKCGREKCVIFSIEYDVCCFALIPKLLVKLDALLKLAK